MSKRVTVLLGGVGFLASHLIPHILPHTDHIVLVDRDRVEQVNYDNALFPKHYEGRWKVMAEASLIQMLSSVKVSLVHKNIKTSSQIRELCDTYNVDFLFITFDNVEARLLARDYAVDAHKPALFIGVTDSFIYIDWAENIVLPQSTEEIAKVRQEIERVRDVCTRLEFRPLGAIAAGYAYHCFTQWLNTGSRTMYNISVKENIRSTNLKYEG